MITDYPILSIPGKNIASFENTVATKAVTLVSFCPNSSSLTMLFAASNIL